MSLLTSYLNESFGYRKFAYDPIVTALHTQTSADIVAFQSQEIDSNSKGCVQVKRKSSYQNLSSKALHQKAVQAIQDL